MLGNMSSPRQEIGARKGTGCRDPAAEAGERGIDDRSSNGFMQLEWVKGRNPYMKTESQIDIDDLDGRTGTYVKAIREILTGRSSLQETPLWRSSKSSRPPTSFEQPEMDVTMLKI